VANAKYKIITKDIPGNGGGLGRKTAGG